MKKYLLIFFSCISLQSCFWVQHINEWQGSPGCSAISDSTSDYSRLRAFIDLSRRPLFLPLPFFFFNFDISKLYTIQFLFISKTNKYKKVDSIYYQLFTQKDSLIYTGIVSAAKQQSFFKITVFKLTPWKGVPRNDTTYRAALYSGYHVNLPLKKQKDLKINITLYATKKDNQSGILNFESFTLKKEWNGIGFFTP